VHPLAKKGRMKLGGEGYLSSGVEIVDFAVELFDTGRVAVAGEDGAVRVWKVGQAGVNGVAPEAEQVLKGERGVQLRDHLLRSLGKGIDKIAQVEFHPTARDLLVVGSNDSGTSAIRFFDLATGDETKVCHLDAKGIFNFSWSPKGDRLAISTKNGHVLVLDPRDPSSVISGPAHDSPRSFQLEWIHDAHLISVGFSRGSQRKINLYNIGAEVKTISSVLVDISPSVLFARYDPDTCILYVWGKGERVIQAYEIHPDANEPIAKLPSYTAGDAQVGVCWLPKRTVDVKRVEVARVLRLTGKTMEEVSFSIPRNKVSKVPSSAL
jgi:WD40 repeat protein